MFNSILSITCNSIYLLQVCLLLQLLFLYLFQSIIRERFATDINEDVQCQDCKQQKVITISIIYVITLRRKVITPIPTMYDMNIDYIYVFHRHLHC